MRFTKLAALTFCSAIAMIIVLFAYTDQLFYKRIYYRLDNTLKRYSFAEEKVHFTETKIKLNEQIDRFIATVSNLSIFLIDPFVIYHLISDKHKKSLLDKQLISESIAKSSITNGYCVSFGVFKSDIDLLDKILDKSLEEQSFSVITVDGPDGSQRRVGFSNDSYLPTVLLHKFYIKSDQCIQVSVLHQRSDFFWIGRLPDIRIVAKIRHKLHYGYDESAFDRFQVIKTNIAALSVLVPDNCVHFLAQFTSSKFIECNYETTEQLRQKYGTNGITSEAKNQKVLEGLRALKQFTKKLEIPFFIVSGTLLGWYRQCSVIPHTFDVDTATWSIYASDQTIDSFIHNDALLKLAYIYGLVNNGLEFALYSISDLRIDVFFTYPENNNFTYTGHITEHKSYFRYIFPQFTLCSAELVGLKVLVPCDPHLILTNEYGPDWTELKKEWSSSSSYNQGPKMYWTDEEFKLAYRPLVLFP